MENIEKQVKKNKVSGVLEEKVVQLQDSFNTSYNLKLLRERKLVKSMTQ